MRCLARSVNTEPLHPPALSSILTLEMSRPARLLQFPSQAQTDNQINISQFCPLVKFSKNTGDSRDSANVLSFKFHIRATTNGRFFFVVSSCHNYLQFLLLTFGFSLNWSRNNITIPAITFGGWR